MISPVELSNDNAQLNDFERSILERIAHQMPALLPIISKLEVSSREFTGVGSYTNFVSYQGFALDTSPSPIVLDYHIAVVK